MVVNKSAKAVLNVPDVTCLLPAGVLNDKANLSKCDVFALIIEEREKAGAGKAKCGARRAVEVVGVDNYKPLN